MSLQFYEQGQSGSAAERYERHFVPTIGRPVAEDLIAVAAPRPGERVLDVACGTGVVTRMVAGAVGESGRVTGSDVDASMLAVARSSTSDNSAIRWHETAAEAIPYEAESYDLVTCQMGLQFIADRAAALREMRRVLVPGGRIALNVPGPTPAIFEVVADELSRHIHPEVGAKLHLVFALHEPDELHQLMVDAGFVGVETNRAIKVLDLPPAEQFLWQYIGATPLSAAFANADDKVRASFERDVCQRWQDFVVDGQLRLEVGMTTATGYR